MFSDVDAASALTAVLEAEYKLGKRSKIKKDLALITQSTPRSILLSGGGFPRAFFSAGDAGSPRTRLSFLGCCRDRSRRILRLATPEQAGRLYFGNSREHASFPLFFTRKSEQLNIDGLELRA